jgi:hypothetical protein
VKSPIQRAPSTLVLSKGPLPDAYDRSVRMAEIYATSILALDRSDKQATPEAVVSEVGDEPAD